MKKYSYVLKKAEVFEKMALYGSRKKLLKSLASGDDPLAGPFKDLSLATKSLDEAKAVVGQAISGLKDLESVLAVNDTQLGSIISPASNAPDLSTQVSTLQTIARRFSESLIAANNADGARKANSIYYSLNDASRKIQVFYDNVPAIPADTGTSAPSTLPSTKSPTAYVSNAPGGKSQYINVQDQKNVQKYCLVLGISGQSGFLDPDGVIGPKTRKSIDAAKRYLNMSGASDTQLFAKIREELKKPPFVDGPPKSAEEQAKEDEETRRLLDEWATGQEG